MVGPRPPRVNAAKTSPDFGEGNHEVVEGALLSHGPNAPSVSFAATSPASGGGFQTHAGSTAGSSTKPFQVCMYFTKVGLRPSRRRCSALTGVRIGVKSGSAASFCG